MGTWNSDESGQIIIIAALLLAIIFVGLALVLNSAIYTENMARRGDTSTAEAMSTESVTEERLGSQWRRRTTALRKPPTPIGPPESGRT